jgi:flagellin
VGYGAAGVVSAASWTDTGTAAMIASGGASQTGLGTSNDVFSFAGLRNSGAQGGTIGSHGDQQVLSFSATDANGALQATSVTLSASNASDVSGAVKAINDALQNSGNTTLKNIVAVKETNAAGTAEGIRFISSLNNFSVNVGQAANNTSSSPVGLYDGTVGATSTQGMTVGSSSSGAIDISSEAGAKQAVSVLGQAVKTLGSAQAAIGKGQNQLGYAIALANSQIANFSSAQAQIRDADVASEAANLSKAQVLQQASIAAMAQANSAPQAVLSLLRG